MNFINLDVLITFFRLDLQYVDVISTVRYIMSEDSRSEVDDMSSHKLTRLASRTLNIADIKDPFVALKTEITHILDTKVAEAAANSKGKKKEEPVVSATPTDYSGAALTEELCGYIPHELLRECLLLRLNTDPKIIKKGYVLDLWKRVFGNLLDFMEITRGHQQESQPQVDENKIEIDENAEEGEDDSINGAPSKHENYLAGSIQLIVELQVFIN